MTNIAEFARFAIGVFLAWAAKPAVRLLLSDPGRWLELSDWHAGFFATVAAAAEVIPVWPRGEGEPLRPPVCFPEAALVGWGQNLFTSPRNSLLFRQVVSAYGPVRDLRFSRQNVLLAVRPHGEFRRGFVNMDELVDRLQQRLYEFVEPCYKIAPFDHTTLFLHTSTAIKDIVAHWSQAGVVIALYGAAVANAYFLPVGASLVLLDMPLRQTVPAYEPFAFHHIQVQRVPLDWPDAQCMEPGILPFGHIELRYDQLSRGFLDNFPDAWWYQMEKCDYVAPIDETLRAFDRALLASFSFHCPLRSLNETFSSPVDIGSLREKDLVRVATTKDS